MFADPIKAVFFDFGDTLAQTVPPFFTRIATAMRHAGCDISDKAFESAYLKTDYEIYRRYKANSKIMPDEYVEWFFPILCNNLALEGDPLQIRARMRESLRHVKCKRIALPGAVGALATLKEKGFILGIISNNDGRVDEKCDEVGIKEYFDIIADSTVLGLVKPDRRIFHFVLDKLGLSPDQALHIGDLYGSDVMGGLNAGLDVIWFNKRQIGKLSDTEVVEIRNLSEVKLALGLDG